MTKLLEQAFAKASQLPPQEQDALADWLLKELESDERWSALFAGSQDALSKLAGEALAEHRAGKTQELGEKHMRLEDYFDFDTLEIGPFGLVETIRVKGSRIGIEHILEPYLQGDSPERIYQGYRHSLSLEQVYATITYYLHNKTKIDEYLKKGEEIEEYHYQEHLKKGPSEAEQKLRKLKAAQTP